MTKDKPWAQLIKSRYLQGKNILEEYRDKTNSSWLWGGLKKCIHILRKGTCYQVGAGSELCIINTPWLPKLEGFQIPAQLQIQSQYQKIKDLLIAGSEWNGSLVQSLFPSQISDLIMNTPILNLEHERLIWTPSSSGLFSVKSTYNMVVRGRFQDQAEEQHRIWNLIWDSQLHGRHRLIL